MKKVVFVCLGNICRSPMAEFVMKGLTDQLIIESRATSSWEHGNPIHKGTQQILQHYQIPYDSHKYSRQIILDMAEEYDYIIGMDSQNIADLKKMLPARLHDKIYPFAEKSVPDPWYTGDFEETYRMVTAGCLTWKDRLL
ncbi:low molecular weight protein-tyrosine-phosphatase [Streptococcus acidominimus]|uniref:protein-tyrosine-phosphatase n=1 Tax=Streptococcus acidominimus TaxID=1326 RepID=A0A4Y9FLR8_STRAI|nr:low molecular weight protein-tyrosine-phosphatase [Streptococcus acidominimus]MBF0819231.1 low molecular weight phosphotyrosine protein phosphatase [Streptococcus acidominimus]MBF0839467.1 low molecular weight phosphotyrosine protein phosphatase [Streptococcus acidominimus]MBF0847929.1 low molecular weight phosphotyrosine protein phosphatase [Streptococcus danieliae]TFU30157.1 low molecular weight phosphotyrosine protein phosphatase [Streptococcus acidominimus]